MAPSDGKSNSSNRNGPAGPKRATTFRRIICFGATVLLLLLNICVIAIEQKAKRSAPKPVPPVVHKGVKYTAPHFVDGEAAGGVVEALDAKTGKIVWRLKVYEMNPAPNLERDVQDVFITSLAIDGNNLLVTNERHDRYSVDLKTHAVSKR